jgi:hypothetical protein
MIPIYIPKNLTTGMTIEIPKKFMDTLKDEGMTMVLMPCKLSSGEEGYVLKPGAIDFSSKKMQKAFTLWVEVMRKVAAETLPAEVMYQFFHQFATEIQDWEEKAQSLL